MTIDNECIPFIIISATFVLTVIVLAALAVYLAISDCKEEKSERGKIFDYYSFVTNSHPLTQVTSV
jgi:hypothetical protein